MWGQWSTLTHALPGCAGLKEPAGPARPQRWRYCPPHSSTLQPGQSSIFAGSKLSVRSSPRKTYEQSSRSWSAPPYAEKLVVQDRDGQRSRQASAGALTRGKEGQHALVHFLASPYLRQSKAVSGQAISAVIKEPAGRGINWPPERWDAGRNIRPSSQSCDVFGRALYFLCCWQQTA